MADWESPFGSWLQDTLYWEGGKHSKNPLKTFYIKKRLAGVHGVEVAFVKRLGGKKLEGGAGIFPPPSQPTATLPRAEQSILLFQSTASGLQYGPASLPATVMVVPTYLGTMALGGVAGLPYNSPYNSLLMSNLPTMGLQMTNSLPAEHTR